VTPDTVHYDLEHNSFLTNNSDRDKIDPVLSQRSTAEDLTGFGTQLMMGGGDYPPHHAAGGLAEMSDEAQALAEAYDHIMNEPPLENLRENEARDTYWDAEIGESLSIPESQLAANFPVDPTAEPLDEEARFQKLMADYGMTLDLPSAPHTYDTQGETWGDQQARSSSGPTPGLTYSFDTEVSSSFSGTAHSGIGTGWNHWAQNGVVPSVQSFAGQPGGTPLFDVSDATLQGVQSEGKESMKQIGQDAGIDTYFDSASFQERLENTYGLVPNDSVAGLMPENTEYPNYAQYPNYTEYLNNMEYPNTIEYPNTTVTPHCETNPAYGHGAAYGDHPEYGLDDPGHYTQYHSSSRDPGASSGGW
jgi:hypothetical protein